MLVKLTGIHQDTYVETGPIYINSNLIAFFGTYNKVYRKDGELYRDPTIYTLLRLTKVAGDQHEDFIIKETPDEVYDLLKGTK